MGLETRIPFLLSRLKYFQLTMENLKASCGLTSLVLSGAGALVTNISMGPSAAWYFQLSPFEAIFLGLVVIKVMLLRMMGILPVSLNSEGKLHFFDRPSRKKRSVELADTMFKVVRRLDNNDCLLRSLCEIQAGTLQGKKFHSGIKTIVTQLNKFESWNGEGERPILSVFKEALEVAWESKTNGTETECQERYFLCPLSKKDILHYVKTIDVI